MASKPCLGFGRCSRVFQCCFVLFATWGRGRLSRNLRLKNSKLFFFRFWMGKFLNSSSLFVVVVVVVSKTQYDPWKDYDVERLHGKKIPIKETVK